MQMNLRFLLLVSLITSAVDFILAGGFLLLLFGRPGWGVCDFRLGFLAVNARLDNGIDKGRDPVSMLAVNASRGIFNMTLIFRTSSLRLFEISEHTEALCLEASISLVVSL
jgi:hypothetical protein